MDFRPSEEQTALCALAREILAKEATPERLRAAERSPEWFDRVLWARLADANLLGVALPEEYGGIGLGFFDPAAFAEYVRCFNEKTIRGSCEDYRACATCDLEMDTADRKAGVMIKMPALVVWGGRSHTGQVYGDLLKIWRDYADNLTGG